MYEINTPHVWAQRVRESLQLLRSDPETKRYFDRPTQFGAIRLRRYVFRELRSRSVPVDYVATKRLRHYEKSHMKITVESHVFGKLTADEHRAELQPSLLAYDYSSYQPYEPHDQPQSPPTIATPLQRFRAFCEAGAREVVDDTSAEIKRIVREEWDPERNNRRHLWLAAQKHALKCIVVVTLDECQRLVVRYLPFLRFLGF